jgi:uracil-DNA glycosylase
LVKRTSSLRDARASRRAERLAALVAAIRACRICVDRPQRAPLPHAPNPILRASTTARLCIASQAAGTRAHASSVPFDDASGERLRSWLGVTRDEFYDERRVAILPMGFCFPGQDAKGGDLPPRRECAAAWRTELFNLLPQLELILAIGMHAQQWHCADGKGSLDARVADWRSGFADKRRPRVIALPHPSWRNNAWLTRNPWFEADLLPVLRAAVKDVLDTRSIESCSNQAPKVAARQNS